MRLPSSLNLGRCPIARFSLVAMFFVALLCVSLIGCSYTHVAPNGEIHQVAIGQASTRYCETQTRDAEEICTETKGGALSDGFMHLIQDIVRLPFVIVGGATSAVSGK